jgi:rfaE bifunctional protein kinase chain/domain
MTHSSRQQVVRVDREPNPLHENHPALLELISSAREYARASDAFLVSDYGYGAATPRLLTFIRSNGSLNDMPVTLDSRYRMMDYSGITAATPNEAEVEAALGVTIGKNNQQLLDAGNQLIKQMKLQSLVITRGSDGMVAFEKKHKPVEIPIFGSDEVADVTGAGDTVIATFTAALAAGADTETAARLANFAGGIVVMKRGTATVSQQELLHAIEQAG